MTAAAAFAVFAGPGSAGTTIVVQTAVEEDDDLCSLTEAIEAANTDAIADGCPAGDAFDTIIVPAGAYFPVFERISEGLAIRGTSAGDTILEGTQTQTILTVDEGIEVTLADLTLTGGYGFNGGAIENLGDLTVVNSTLTGNRGINGGAIFSAGRLTIRNSTVSENGASADGGGIMNGGPLAIIRSTISGNSASQFGGGIAHYDDDDTSTIMGSTIANNRATYAGGIYNTGNLIVGRSALVRNEGGGGSGIYNRAPSSLFLADSTLSQNVGGVAVRNLGTMTISYSTIAGNPGGGIYHSGESTVLARSVAASNGDENCLGPVTDGDHNVVWPDTTCPGLRADPKLGLLASNGGPTPTHAVTRGSAALNRIPEEHDACQGVDQRGRERPYGSGCDSGAYEHRRTLSRTTVVKRLRSDSIRAYGALTPAHPDSRVGVSLLRRVDGRFVRLATKRAGLDMDGRYRAVFRRPNATRCRLVTVFAGDFDHFGSRAIRTFDC